MRQDRPGVFLVGAKDAIVNKQIVENPPPGLLETGISRAAGVITPPRRSLLQNGVLVEIDRGQIGLPWSAIKLPSR